MSRGMTLGCALALCIGLLGASPAAPQEAKAAGDPSGEGLSILWTTSDPEVFTKVVFPYGINSMKNGWWDRVTLIVWGPSAKLLSENAALQGMVKKMGDAGVRLTACKWCADEYGVSKKLEQIGVEVKYMGKPLTEFLKSGQRVLVF